LCCPQEIEFLGIPDNRASKQIPFALSSFTSTSFEMTSSFQKETGWLLQRDFYDIRRESDVKSLCNRGNFLHDVLDEIAELLIVGSLRRWICYTSL